VGERYPVGSVINGKVRNLTDFGAFVELEEGIDGLIHISDMSWNRRLKHPNEVLKKGDTVQARVTSVDADNQRLSLSIKEFLPNEWDNFAKLHNVGDEIVGSVSKVTDFGLFIRVTDGVEALAHVSEINRDIKVKLDKTFQVGEPIRARIIKIDWTEKKIGLSTRDVEPLSAEERAAVPGAEASAAPAPATGETEPAETAAPESTTKS
jgi:small subunit ribosomal protein S1